MPPLDVGAYCQFWAPPRGVHQEATETFQIDKDSQKENYSKEGAPTSSHQKLVGNIIASNYIPGFMLAFLILSTSRETLVPCIYTGTLPRNVYHHFSPETLRKHNCKKIYPRIYIICPILSSSREALVLCIYRYRDYSKKGPYTTSVQNCWKHNFWLC